MNEATLWSGAPREWNNPGAKEALPQVRAAIFAGDYLKAGELCKKMQGPYNQSYQPLGDLRLEFPVAAGAVRYERSLDLDRAVATVRYESGGATYTGEIFSSFPDQVIVMRLTCDRPKHIAFTASADSPLRHSVQTDRKDTIVVRGRAPTQVDPSYLNSKDPIRYDDSANPEGMTFDLHIRVLAEGGSVTRGGSTISVSHADSVMLILSAGTSFNGYDNPPDPGRRKLRL